MTVRYLLAWIPMVLIAIANAAIREFTYGTHLTELRAHQVSSLTAVAFFGLYIWGLTRVWKLESSGQALTIGLTWLVLTVAFEFGFGHWVAGHPWNRLLHDYNLFAGRLWAVILLWVTTAPWVFYRLHR